MTSLPPLAAIKSASDIGSAVGHALKRAGWHPVLLEGPAPGVTRRLMAFAPAVREGRAALAGLTGVRCDTAAQALALRLDPGVLPVLVVGRMDPAEHLAPEVVVDARMRKRQAPPVQIGEAPLTLGIGPGFVCGTHVHGVIESNWGTELGRVLWSGRSQDYTGKHREIGGFGRERYLYAPDAGRFRTRHDVLDLVRQDEIVGWVDAAPLYAAIAGILRGLAYDGLYVAAGAKLVEIDPTGDPARCRGIGERQAAIAEGVLTALRERGVVRMRDPDVSSA